MKLSEAVSEVIRLGDASRAYWDTELPRRHPHYPVIRSGEDSGPPPPENARMQALLKSLPEDQLYKLLMLVYVGRGDFAATPLSSAFQSMKESFPNKDMAVAHMIGMNAIAEYLRDAVDEIHRRKMDVDTLEFASTAA